MSLDFARAARSALFLAALAACSSPFHHGQGRGGAAAVRMLYSPNGEPLTGGPLGHPGCAEAMDRWFARVDTNHDGRIDREEFLADARIQFARMDLDHDGNITSDELATFRAPFMADAEVPEAYEAPEAPEAPPAGGGRHHRQGGGSGSRSAPAPAPAFGSGADPVMSADTNLDFKVTLDEFLRQADETFASLAAGHDGLTPDDVKRSCAGSGGGRERSGS